MVASEIKKEKTTVRIHDTFCNQPTKGCLSRVNQIVSNSYIRRISAEMNTQNKVESPMPQ